MTGWQHCCISISELFCWPPPVDEYTLVYSNHTAVSKNPLLSIVPQVSPPVEAACCTASCRLFSSVECGVVGPHCACVSCFFVASPLVPLCCAVLCCIYFFFSFLFVSSCLCLISSCLIVFCLVLSYLVLSCLVVCCLVLSCLICLVLFVSSCLVLSAVCCLLFGVWSSFLLSASRLLRRPFRLLSVSSHLRTILPLFSLFRPDLHPPAFVVSRNWMDGLD